MRNDVIYNERIYLTILKIIEVNGNIDILINGEMDYFKIGQYIKKLKSNGLVRDYLGELEVTQFGINEMNRLQNKMNFGNIEKLIIPDFKYFIDKKDLFEVYLP